MTDIEKLCSGCVRYERNRKKKPVYACKGFRTKDLHCPCQVCLVKVMCKKDCKHYRLKWEGWHGWSREDLNK